MPNRTVPAAAAALLLAVSAALAADAFAPIPRKLPPPATAQLSAADRTTLETDLANLQKRLAAAEAAAAARPGAADLLADVKVYEKAVRLAIADDEFYEGKKPAAPAKGAAKGGEKKAAAEKKAPAADADAVPAKPAVSRPVGIALDLLKSANRRLDELDAGKPSWTTKKGAVVRGYVSEVDGSVQPYGLDITDDVDLDKPAPLYIWLHGRGDAETDLYFIKGREGKGGELRPKGAIVLHPFGRHCVGFKSAGEIDVLDAVESVKKRYKIDPNRIVLAGFSMGGAGTWHVGAHYADHWVVVHPGAGFVDVLRYQKADVTKVPAAERLMWGAYDVPDYVRNLFNTTVVSYSGENDGQRASANIMAEAFKEQGKVLTQFIGPKVEHKWLPLPDMLKTIADAVAKGRDPNPSEVHLQTRTLRYSRQFWVEATGLGEHWAEARIDASAKPDGSVEVLTKNVTSLALYRPAKKVTVDKQPLTVPAMPAGASPIRIAKTNGKWAIVPSAAPAGGKLAKRPGLQGPIDDAFMAPFLLVAPTGPAVSPAVEQWVAFEMQHQQDRWRSLFRGEPRVKKDTEVTPDDVAKYNLVLWGDAKSNQLIAKAAGKLPATWADGKLAFGGRQHDAATHLPALIYPNPLNPAKYVVLNSGPTFREADDKTNSLQNPKLGDWAILDVTVAPSAAAPGGVVENGIFDEAWQPKPVTK